MSTPSSEKYMCCQIVFLNHIYFWPGKTYTLYIIQNIEKSVQWQVFFPLRTLSILAVFLESLHKQAIVFLS